MPEPLTKVKNIEHRTSTALCEAAAGSTVNKKERHRPQTAPAGLLGSAPMVQLFEPALLVRGSDGGIVRQSETAL